MMRFTEARNCRGWKGQLEKINYPVWSQHTFLPDMLAKKEGSERRTPVICLVLKQLPIIATSTKSLQNHLENLYLTNKKSSRKLEILILYLLEKQNCHLFP